MKDFRADQLDVVLDSRRILRAIDLHVHAGEMLGLIGPNGAGKSTLLRALAGVQPAAGHIRLDGKELSTLNPLERARRIAWLAQNGPVHWPMNIARIVALGRQPWHEAEAVTHEKTQRLLDACALGSLSERHYDTLSGGEKARVLLARALAGDPELLLADEPTAALDLSHQLEVMERLRAHCRRGNAVIVVLHDLRLAGHYCDRLQFLKDGKTLVSGPPRQVITSHWLKTVYDIRLRDGRDALEAFSLNWRLRHHEHEASPDAALPGQKQPLIEEDP